MSLPNQDQSTLKSSTNVSLSSMPIYQPGSQPLYPVIFQAIPQQQQQQQVPIPVIAAPINSINNVPLKKDQERQPLLHHQVVTPYPVYHPQYVIQKAKSSRSCCACAVFGCCCCLLFLVAACIGAVIAAFAVQCSNLQTIDTTTYSASVDYLQMMTINVNGDISINFVDGGAQNITLTVTKKAPNTGFSKNFNDYFDTSNGAITFIETVQNAEGLQGIFPCVRANIEIDIPLSLVSLTSMKLNTANGDIDISTTNSSITYSFNTFNAVTINGDLLIQIAIQSNTFYASSVNGDVKITLPVTSSTQLTAGSTNGDVALQDVILNNSSSTSLSTTNGDITISNLFVYSQSASLTAQSINGDVTITTTSYNGNFDAETVNGNADVVVYNSNTAYYNEDTKTQKNGYLNNAVANSITGKTTNGDVDLFFN